MSEREAALLWAIEDIIRQRIILGVIPALALGRELRNTFGVDELAALVPGLVGSGHLLAGHTLNDTWYITQGYSRSGIYEQETRTTIMNEFENTIKAHLDKVAAEDPVFGEKYREALAREDKKKDITHCCNYIIGEVKKTGRKGFTDDEVFGMAMHFYDEAKVTGPDGGQAGCQVVVNHEVKLSADEVKKIQEAARKEAEEKVRREALARIERERKAAEERAKKAEERRKEAEARRKAEEERKRQEAAQKAREEGCLFLFDDLEG